MSSLVGKSLEGRYLLKREISLRSRTVVYEAEHVVTRRPVAIKMLHAEAAGDHAQRQALLAEARMLTEVRHPAIVEVLDAGMTQLGSSVDMAPFVTMELLEGRDLHGLLASRGRFDLTEAVSITVTLCRAVANSHRWGVVHGDITPENIFIPPAPSWQREWGSREVDAKLTGFGRAARELMLEDAPRSKMTELSYRSPEQLDGDVGSERSDVYALAVVLYEMLADALPHGRRVTPLAELREDAPRQLSQALGRALSRDPSARPESAKDLAEALVQLRVTLPPKAEPPHVGRRSSARAAYLTPLRVRREDGSHLDGRCQDISVAGMLVLANKPLQPNKLVTLHFALPGTAKVVEVEAFPRWNRSGRQGICVVGLQFVAAPETVQEAIARYVGFYGEQPRGDDAPAAPDTR